MNVVARFIPTFGKWYLCHATSYQNAFGSKVNGFDTLNAAVCFAEEHGCEVEYHESDQLQHESNAA